MKKRVVTVINYLRMICLILFMLTVVMPEGLFSREPRDIKVFKSFTIPKYRVFIVGNKDYDGTDMDLRYTVNDTIVFRQIFRKVLNVPKSRMHYYTDLTLRQYLSKLRQFAAKMRSHEDEVAVIIYTGHGNTNGMPIFTDKKTVAPRLYFKEVNSFNNDTIVIMDSCYSGAEGSDMLSSDDVDEATARMRSSGGGKTVNDKGYRKNVLRMYSSLSNQQSREDRYKKIPKVQPHFGTTYEFLEEIGYNGDGNGIFSICFSSFFANRPFTGNAYNFDNLNLHISLLVSDLVLDGIPAQRPKMKPFSSPFKKKENYYLLYREIKIVELPEEEKTYIRGVLAQRKGKYKKAIKIYLNLDEYKDVKARLSECYAEIAKRLGVNYPNETITNLESALEYNPNNLLAINFLGQVYLYQGNLREAKTYFSRVLDLAETSKNNYWIALSSNNLGTVYSKDGKEEKALEYFERALEVSIEAKDVHGQASAHNNIGSFYFGKEDTEKALEHFKKARKISKKSGNGLGEASALNNIALVYYHQRKLKKALKRFLFAYKILKKYDRKKEMVLCQNNIALVYIEQKKFNKALQYYAKSLKYYKKTKNKVGLATLHRSIGMVHYKKGNKIKALKHLKKARKIMKKINNRRVEIETIIEIAIIYNGRKRFKKAKKTLLEAQRLSETIGYQEGEARALVNLMEVYRNLGKQSFKKKKYNESIKYSVEALSIYKQAEDEISMGRVNSNIGLAHYKLKNYDKALQFLEKGLNYSKKTDDKQGSRLAMGYIAEVSYSLGVDYAESEDYGKAVEALKRAFALKKELGYYNSAAGIAINLAATYNNNNDTENAIIFYTTAINLYKRVKKNKKVPKIYANIGRIYLEAEEYRRARKNLELSLDYYERYKGKAKDIRQTRRYLAYASNAIGDKFLKRKKYRKALRYYKKSIKILSSMSSKDIALENAYLGAIKSSAERRKHKDAIYYKRSLVELLRRKNSPKLEAHEEELKEMEEALSAK